MEDNATTSDINLMQYVQDKKYTEFSSAVKAEMQNKLANTPQMRDYVSEFDKIQNMKSLFAQINKGQSSEPAGE